MKKFEIIQNEFIISTDKSKLDVEMIHGYLSGSSYWAKHIPLDTVKKSISGSCCFGLYVAKNRSTGEQWLPGELPPGYFGRQVGFARVITDQATFAYIADVFVVEAFRGKGLSKMSARLIPFGRADGNDHAAPRPAGIAPVVIGNKGCAWPVYKIRVYCS